MSIVTPFRAALAALGLSAAVLDPSATLAGTTYPLTIENCGQPVTFKAAPKRVVALGQSQTEILYALGLGDRVVGTAVWFGPVAKGFEAVNAGVRRLADNDPSFESVVGQEPDLVTAMFEWHLGANGKVGRRDQFAGLGINAYVSPTDCVGKDNSGTGDGVRTQPFSMELVYRNILDYGRIFDVSERAEVLVSALRTREEKAAASVAPLKGKGVSVALWFSSKDVKGDAFMAGATGIPGYVFSKLGARNVIETADEWPTVGWETIAAANPSVLVVIQMDRRRFPADDVAVKMEFLRTDPVASRLDAVKNGRIAVMDVSATRAGLDTIDGIEALAAAIKGFGLSQ